MKKRIVSALAAALLALSVVTGCGNSAVSTQTGIEDETASMATASDSGATGTAAAAEPQGKVYRIAVNEFNDFDEVDQCREGFFEGLAREGFVEGKNLDVDLKDADADAATVSENAKKLAADNYDMIFSIGTPATQASYEAASENGTPVVYAAVSDPVRAGLAKEDGTPVGEVTGTSDTPAVEERLKLIRQLMPDATTIGILHTTSEINSTAEIETYRELATEYGFEIRTSAVSSSASIDVSVKALEALDADCIVMVHDNTLADHISKIVSEARSAEMPVFGITADQMDHGCIAGYAVDYVQAGIDAGEMAAKILKGESKASEISCKQENTYSLYLNTKTARRRDIEIPDELTQAAAEVYD